jgi:hypothetical protein
MMFIFTISVPNFVSKRSGPKVNIGKTNEEDIKELDPRKACKYLCVEEIHKIQHNNEKKKLKEYFQRLKLVLDSELSIQNKT